MKYLAFCLLRGDSYLMPRTDTKGRARYMLYKGNQDPETYISNAAIKKYRHLLKKDRKNRFTVNLSMVRQQHGKTYIKKLYNNLKTKI